MNFGQVWLQDQSMHSDDMMYGFRLVVVQHVFCIKPNCFNIVVSPLTILSSFRFTVLASKEKAIPPMAAGDILRISGLRIEETSSGFDGRVYRYCVLQLGHVVICKSNKKLYFLQFQECHICYRGTRRPNSAAANRCWQFLVLG